MPPDRGLPAQAAAYPSGWRTWHMMLALAILLVLAASAQRLGLDVLLGQLLGAVAAGTGLGPPSPVAAALLRGIGQLVPLQLADAGAPLGYLWLVVAKMIETLEIALWGSLVAVLLGLPLALLAARCTMPHAVVRMLVRWVIAALRAVPELISALFLVMAFGFGPAAGVLALGLHAAGFLGKFYADDIDAADPAPGQALSAIGASPLAVWRAAVLPAVLPQFIAYTFYVLDRNVRMATVIGLVGAGGIGQELRGRFDMYQFGHVGTILLITLLVVAAIDMLAIRLRRAAGL